MPFLLKSHCDSVDILAIITRKYTSDNRAACSKPNKLKC